MIDPLFWLGLSILLVAVSLTAVLVAALPAFLELARAARSVEKLAETLRRELPPTLEAIRLTGMEISELTDDVSESVKSASQAAKQVDQSIGSAKKQAQNVQIATRSLFTGVKAAWKSFRRPPALRRSERLSTQKSTVESRVYADGTSSVRGNSATPLPSRLGTGGDSPNRKELPESSSKIYWERDSRRLESNDNNTETSKQEASDALGYQKYYEDWQQSEEVKSEE